MTTITMDRLYMVARELPAARENPRNAHGKCIYTNRDGEHCLIGEILTRLGLPCPEYGGALNTTELTRLPGILANFEPVARDALVTAQYRADGGSIWHDALRAAGLLVAPPTPIQPTEEQPNV